MNRWRMWRRACSRGAIKGARQYGRLNTALRPDDSIVADHPHIITIASGTVTIQSGTRPRSR